jgi:penicillin amidase
MEKVLPPAVTAFFTPDTDPYTDYFDRKACYQAEPSGSIPVRALKSLLTGHADPDHQTNVISVPFLGNGSNGWLVAPAKIHDGRAILANDMHLKLGVPNIWYRAELHYGSNHFAGLTLPGVPLPIAGSNRRVAWGFTNIQGDFSDLILLDMSPEAPNVYQTSHGMRQFGARSEKIRVKGTADELLLVRTTEWGPVLLQKLLGREVAIRWTVLDPRATNLDLLNLDRVSTVSEAIAVFNRAGGPPLSVLVADRQGNIGWSYMGKIPVRRGFSGLVSRSWARGEFGWRSYIAPEELPRLINPPSGYLASANQRMIGRDYPYVIGHDYVNGYRAYRISEQLRALNRIREKDMLSLQLDTRAGFYDFYRKLALEALDSGVVDRTERLAATLRQQLAAWHGRAEPDSKGLAVLVEFRRSLAEVVLSPFLERCRESDGSFVYAWKNLDVPLQRLLTTKIPELLPYQEAYHNWDEFIGAILLKSARRLMERTGVSALEEFSWGRVNKVRVSHPFSQVVPALRYLLDMPEVSLAGCDLCVRVVTRTGGASERLVVSPGREKDGILHMPGGQSGHPLSPHYRDQQRNWVDGIPTPLLAGEPRHHLILKPARGE